MISRCFQKTARSGDPGIPERERFFNSLGEPGLEKSTVVMSPDERFVKTTVFPSEEAVPEGRRIPGIRQLFTMPFSGWTGSISTYPEAVGKMNFPFSPAGADI